MASREGLAVLVILDLQTNILRLPDVLQELHHHLTNDILHILSSTFDQLQSGPHGLHPLLVAEECEEQQGRVEEEVVLHQVDRVEGHEVQQLDRLDEGGDQDAERGGRRDGREGGEECEGDDEPWQVDRKVVRLLYNKEPEL